MRIAARRHDGIVIEGGKQHVVGAPVVHELLIVPERAIADDQSELAIACAVPVDSRGVRMIANTAAPRVEDDRSYPVSRRHAVFEAVVVFDQVFVPGSASSWPVRSSPPATSPARSACGSGPEPSPTRPTGPS